MIDVDISTYIPNGEWDLVGKKKNTKADIKRCPSKTQHKNVKENQRQRKKTSFFSDKMNVKEAF